MSVARDIQWATKRMKGMPDQRKVGHVSSGRMAMRRTKTIAKRVSGRAVIGGGLATGGYYLGHRSSAQSGITSQNKGMYTY